MSNGGDERKKSGSGIKKESESSNGEESDSDSESEQVGSVTKRGKRKLREARVCRVFFSSPFRGMEAERELLTKQYFPTLQSLCNTHGVQFIPVDMRWGISHELSTNAKTIEICLREIDRSDIFVGFFGQRYGWHGLDDPDLQENMANAAKKYPWIDQYRDKSVTEIEFLHGHLNSPGQMPAVLAFRDQRYDDAKREEAENANDLRRKTAFSSEGEHATKCLSDLKDRVKNVEDKALTVHMSFKDPAEGAKLMFEALNDYMETLMKELGKTEESAQAKAQTHHDSFLKSRMGVYVGGNKYIDRLDGFVLSESAAKRAVMVTGEAGSGKSALLANWLNLTKERQNQLSLYHFIGCAEGTTKPKQIALNLVSQLENALLTVQHTGKRKQLKDKMESQYSSKTTMNLRDLILEFTEKLIESKQYWEKVVIIVDGLDKITQDTISTQLFSWLPGHEEVNNINYKIVLSTLNSDKAHIQQAAELWRAQILDIEPLDIQDRSEICVKMLKLRGKELSGKQLNRVSHVERADNPLFLKIILEELCAFGSFRQLDQKIDSLVACKNVTQLFQQVLERLEEDYNTPEFNGNLVEQTLCSICISRTGLKEDDMMNMLKIASHVWSPLYFALEQYISVRNGLLGFVYHEMKNAIEERYMDSEPKKQQVAIKVVDHLLERLQQIRDRGEKKFPSYWSSTLPWMCRKYSLKGRLIKVLTNMKIAEDLLDSAFWELINSWNYLGCKGPEIVYLYSKYGIDAEISKLYDEYLGGLITSKRLVTESIRINYNLVILINDRCKYMKAGLRPLHRAKRILDTTAHLPKDDPKYIEWYMDIGNQLACSYGDMTMYDKSLYYHEDVAAFCRAQKNQSQSVKIQYPMSLHGIGLAYMKLERYKESEDMFLKSIKLTEELNMSDKKRKIGQAYTNMGLMYWQQNKIDEAIEYTEKSIDLYKEYHFGKDHIDTAYAYNNLGIFYRKKKRLDDAEKVYKKSMDLKVKQLGYQHYDIAVGYVNLQNLCLQRKQYEKGLEHARKAWDIYVAIDAADLIPAMQCFENIILLLIKCNKWEEAEEKFWVIFEWLKKPGGLGLNKGLPFVHKQMVLYFYRHKQYDKILKILPDIMQTRFLMPIHYAILARCDHIKGISLRPKELTLEYGIEKHPLYQELRRPQFLHSLIPNRDIDVIKSELNKFFDVCKEKNPDEIAAEALDLCVFCAFICKEQGWRDGTQSLEQWLIDKFPPEGDFTVKTTLKDVAEDLVTGIGPTAVEDEKVIIYSTIWLDMFGEESEDKSIMKTLIEATIKLRSLDEAKTKWNQLMDTCDDTTARKINDLLSSYEEENKKV